MTPTHKPTWIQRAALAVAGWKASAAQVISTGLTPLSPELISFFGGSSVAGKAVNAQTSLNISTAFSCMRIISESIGMLPWSLFERDPNGRDARRADDHPLAEVLTLSPNEDMTSVEFREALSLNLCQSGNAFAFRDTLAGRTSSLYPIPSTKCVTKRKKGGNTKLAIPEGAVFYSVNDRDQWADYPREKIWHIKGFGPSGVEGLSPIGCARESMGFALATDEFGSRFFSQGGKPSGIVTIPGFLTKDQREIARENLQQMMGGLGNAHKFALFEGGMTPKEWSHLPLADLEFLALRQFNVAEMCRIYRIPPHMVADVQKGAAYASIEQMSAEFVMFTLMPYFTRIEASVAKWLLSAEDRKRFFLRFNYEGLLRADSKARSEFYASAVQNGWMNRNEVRAKENLNWVDGLDDFTAQVNLAPVEDLGDLAEANVARGRGPVVGGAAEPKARDTNISTSIALPTSLQHEVSHSQPEVLALAESVASLARSLTTTNGELNDGVATLARTVARSHDEVLGAVKESTDRIAGFVIEGQSSLAFRLTEGHDNLQKALREANDAVAAALAKSASTRYRLVLNKSGEAVGREPVADGEEITPRVLTN